MIIPILAIIVVIVMWVTFSARQKVRFCRWRENRAKDTAMARYYICMNCGAEVLQDDFTPPKACQKTGAAGS